MSCSQSAGQQLSVDDLPVVTEELNDTRAKWYDIGLQLHLSAGTLDAIKKDCNSTSDCLRETLTTWLKTCPSLSTWKNILDALRCSTVGEVRLAADLEQKYCSMQDSTIAATNHHALPAPQSQADTQTTSPQQSQSQAHVTLAPPVSPSQPLAWTTPPTQYSIPPTQPPVLAYFVTPCSHPSPWSAPYYYPPHTSYPLPTPFPLTPPPSGLATASIHPSYSSQVPQVIPTSSIPLLPSVPTQLTTPQFPATCPQYPSPPSLTTIPPDTLSIPPLATAITPPHFPLPETTHSLGMKVLSHLKSAYSVLCSI